MVEICFGSFLAISVYATVLFWLALASAKRDDRNLHEIEEVSSPSTYRR